MCVSFYYIYKKGDKIMKILDYRILAIFFAFFSLSVLADNPGDEDAESVVRKHHG